MKPCHASVRSEDWHHVKFFDVLISTSNSNYAARACCPGTQSKLCSQISRESPNAGRAVRTLLLLAQPAWREDNLNDPLSSPLPPPAPDMITDSSRLQCFTCFLGKARHCIHKHFPRIGQFNNLFSPLASSVSMPLCLTTGLAACTRVKLNFDESCFTAISQIGLAGLREARRCSEYLGDRNDFTDSQEYPLAP